MAILAFLANEFSALGFSSVVSYPLHVPSFLEWYPYMPKFSGNTNRRLDQHLKDFHECMEQLGVVFEDVKMKLFMYSLE